MSQATSEKSKPLIPPDERFWQRYSPHHEFPLSGIGSLALHGLVIGTMLLVGWWLSRRWYDDFAKPPSMDVVQVEGGGTGFEGLGGGSGLPGKIDPAGGKKEFVETNPNLKEFKAEQPVAKLKEPLLFPEKVPELSATETDLSNVELDTIAKDADKVLRQMMKLQPRPAPSTGPVGDGPPGGKGTGPVGPGKGYGKGAGTGVGGVPGRALTKQDILASRWRFDLAGDGREHAKKLDAMGVIVGIPDGRGGIVVARNLKQRPVKLQTENLEPYKDAVKWYNTKADSLYKLAQELRIPLPQFVVLLLPKEREEKMAAAEHEYTRRQGKQIEQVQATWFDFRLRGGTYEPEVIRQEYGP